jgi:hypothetical protein
MSLWAMRGVAMTSSLSTGPILTRAQAQDLLAHQEGRPATELRTDVGSIFAAIERRLAKHGPLDVGDEAGHVVARLRLDGDGRLALDDLA